MVNECYRVYMSFCFVDLLNVSFWSKKSTSFMVFVLRAFYMLCLLFFLSIFFFIAPLFSYLFLCVIRFPGTFALPVFHRTRQGNSLQCQFVPPSRHQFPAVLVPASREPVQEEVILHLERRKSDCRLQMGDRYVFHL